MFEKLTVKDLRQFLLIESLPVLLFMGVLLSIGNMKHGPEDFDYEVGDLVQVKLSGQKAQVLRRINGISGLDSPKYKVRVFQPGAEHTNTNILAEDGPIEKNSLVELVVADYELTPYKVEQQY